MTELQRLKTRVEALESLIIEMKSRENKIASVKGICDKAKDVVNKYYDIDIDSKNRESHKIMGLQMYYHYLRENTGLSLKQMGRTLNINQHHATIINHLREFEDNYETEKSYREDWARINDIMKS